MALRTLGKVMYILSAEEMPEFQWQSIKERIKQLREGSMQERIYSI